jgi:hypothetical protein
VALLDDVAEGLTMKAHRAAGAVLLLGPLCISPTLAQGRPGGAADTAYATLVSRGRAGDTTIDYRMLRLSYAQTSSYEPISGERAALRTRLDAAFGSGDTRTAKRLADSLLAVTFIDIHAHVIEASLALAVGDSAGAHAHAAIARGLFGSFAGLNGAVGPGTAIVIVTAEEEEAFGMANGLEGTGRYHTSDCGVRVCDSVVFHNSRTRRDTTVVFDITLVSNKALGHDDRH